MTQRQINRAVALATGEPLANIRRMGFSELADQFLETDREPLIVDWDSLDAQRGSGFPPSFSPPTAA